MDSTRRSFLKLAGFSFVTGCSRGLDHKAIPLLIKAEEITPGRATWYASLCGGCAAGCGILAKNREGRPIKVEGNPDHPFGGGLCAVGQAGVLGLYDSQRLAQPMQDGKSATWAQVDATIAEKLKGAKRVRFLTPTLHSPTQRHAIAEFLARFPDGRHVMADGLSQSALADAHAAMFSRRAVPRFHFDRAQVIASFDADFLGTWISPVEFTRDYRAGRNPDAPNAVVHSFHVQVESRMSLTGSNADQRMVLAPEEIGPALAALEKELASGSPKTDLGRRLFQAPPGSTLVVCGINRIAEQRITARINGLLKNYGSTLDMKRPSYQAIGSEADLDTLRIDVAAGRIDALFVAGSNPLYDQPDQWDFEKTGLVVSLAGSVDETAAAAHAICPDHHYLEAWNDAEPVDGAHHGVATGAEAAGQDPRAHREPRRLVRAHTGCAHHPARNVEPGPVASIVQRHVV